MKTIAPAAVAAAESPTRVFSGSIAISAVRCTLSYLVLPFVLPIIGLTAGIDAELGVLLTPVAIAANLFSMQRFWASDHRYKLAACAVNATFIVLLSVLLAGDLSALSG